MKETIKTFEGKYGTISLVRYTEKEGTIWHVIHSNPAMPGGNWFDNKRDAMICYQFLCAKY